MGWKEQTRKAMVGGSVELKFVGADGTEVIIGHVWPKKLPTEVKDELAEMQREYYRDPDHRGKAKEYAALLEKYKERAKEKGTAFEDEMLSGAESIDLLAVQPDTDPAFRAALYRKALAHGIGKHDFRGDDEQLVGDGLVFDDAIIREILDWDDLASAIYAAVQEWNRPLASRSAGNSKTSPSGCSTEQSLPKDKSATTEAARAS